MHGVIDQLKGEKLLPSQQFDVRQRLMLAALRLHTGQGGKVTANRRERAFSHRRARFCHFTRKIRNVTCPVSKT
jgi:hypothetical protein